MGVIRDTIQQMEDGELQLVAASLSYSTVFALIPFIAVVLAILQYMGGGFEVVYPKVENLIIRNFSDALGQEATRSIRDLIRNISFAKLGLTGAIGLVVTSLRLMYDMEVGINRVWNQKNKRPLYKRVFFYWLLMLLIPFALAFYVSLRSLREIDVVGPLFHPILSSNTLLFLCIFLLFKYVPTAKVRTFIAFISALLTCVTLFVTQKIFAWATIALFTYSRIYGSFAALPLLLLWILIIWHILLGGVALSASLQKRKTA
jgi:membrane protein